MGEGRMREGEGSRGMGGGGMELVHCLVLG